MRLKDKVAIITGGSRGIGYATADKFLKEGATVILTASSQGSADKAVAQLKEKYPDATVAGISPNLSNLESVRNAFREAASKYGCIDILVNNAGVSESTPFTEYTEETFDKVMDLNVKGVFNATRAASECMIAKGNGVILSTSSMVSIYGQPSGFAYGGLYMKRFIPILMMLLLLTGCGAQSSETSYRQISMEEAVTMMEEETGYIILDVRTAQEYSEKHIPGAINIANESIGTEDIPELPDKEQLILVYCRSGNRSKQASEKLVKLGYTNIVEFGGINDWTGETVSGEA